MDKKMIKDKKKGKIILIELQKKCECELMKNISGWGYNLIKVKESRKHKEAHAWKFGFCCLYGYKVLDITI